MATIEVANLERDYLDRIADVTKVNATIKLNGVVLDWLSFKIVTTNTHSADTFEVEVPLYDQAVEDLEILLEAESMEFQIAVDDGTGTFVRLLLGYADDFEKDLINGIVVFLGRDLTSLLMDSKALTENNIISNLTASDVAISFADKHELRKDITQTTTLVGNYDGTHSILLTSDLSEWDLLCKLAQNEDYDLYIKDDILHFKPRTVEKDYYKIDWDTTGNNGQGASNVLRFKLRRNLTIANDVKVIVKSRNVYTGKDHTETSRRQHVPQRNKGRSKTQTYYAYLNNATPDQTKTIAENLQKQISIHEKKLSATLVGDNVLTARSVLKLNGTGKNFDQLYYPYYITRRMSFGEPFLMEVEAKNHDVNTQVS